MVLTGFNGKSELTDDEESDAYSAWLRAQDVDTVADEAVNGWSYLSTCLALGELARRAPQRAMPIVLEHLREPSMYQDCAFACLYRLDRAAALRCVHERGASADIWLFSQMLGEVAGDVGLLPEAAEILPAARLLLRSLRERGLHESPAGISIVDLEVELFLEAFGGLESTQA